MKEVGITYCGKCGESCVTNYVEYIGFISKCCKSSIDIKNEFHDMPKGFDPETYYNRQA